MPLLEVTQIRHVSASIRLADTTATQVDQYAHFINASADDVIEEALKHCFGKDRDFQAFLQSPEAKKVAATLRIRKVPATEAVEAQPKRGPIPAHSAPQPIAVAAGSKA